ncbi:MAG: hypothetical protein M1824_004099 [Vezdaea acicularis]|nr:MAG: hypothetical protein M1824_004099 [Vezdaea acicularis]
MFKVTKTVNTLSEHSKLEFIKVADKLHVGDWVHAYAYLGRGADIPSAGRLLGEAVQDQHAAKVVRTPQVIMNPIHRENSSGGDDDDDDDEILDMS